VNWHEGLGMTRYFCPACWRDFAEDLARCPHCGLDIRAAWNSKDYVDKLIAALQHPEPTTPVRAAYILGRLRATRAVGPLIKLVERTTDPYAAKAAVEALGQIGTAPAREFLASLVGHPAWLVRDAAHLALTFINAPGAPARRTPQSSLETAVPHQGEAG
jgi:HEAT repeat protein